MNSAQSEILKFAVCFYGASFLPKLRRLSHEQIQAVAAEAAEIAGQTPLHLVHTDEFIVRSWEPEEKLSGGKVIALMVFCVWVLCGEDEHKAAPLIEAWPIKEAVLIAKKRE